MPQAPLILSIQSEVVFGHVGQGAARFALQRLGFEVLALPTVLLSNHPGHRKPKGELIPRAKLEALFEGIEALGVLPQIVGVVSGYLGEAGHAQATAMMVDKIKRANAQALYLCDPVFGDDDGAYAPLGVAEAMARHLIPMADILTPNRFELTSLTAKAIDTETAAIAASRGLGRPEILATSIPLAQDQIGTALVTSQEACLTAADRIADPPHGSGDLLAALYLGWRLKGLSSRQALARASGATDAILRQATALGPNELPLIDAQDLIMDARPLALHDY